MTLETTESRATETAPRRVGVIAISAVGLWVAALATLGGLRVAMMNFLPFSDTTEARYGEIARKMVETGDWITPQFDYGVPFWGKPPLHTWLSAMGMGSFGVSEFSGRLFIFTAALGILYIVFHWMKTLYEASLALTVTAVLASSDLFFGASGFVMTDIPMTLGVTLCMVGIFQCMSGAGKIWGRTAFLGIAIGLLAKGPVALVICCIPVFLWGLNSRRRTMLKRLPWASGTVILLAVTLPWYILAEFKTPGFLNYFIIGEHFERFVVPGWRGDLYGSGHERAKGMIWLYALGAFMPWTLFALAIPPRNLLKAFQHDPTGLKAYLLFWIISPLLLFTFAANILAAYALPAMPAAACLGVVLWRETRTPGRWDKFATSGALAFTAALGAGLLFLGVVMPDHPKLRSERSLVTVLHANAPHAQLHYWGSRSYSAEFYRRGRVSVVKTSDALEELSKNSVRDAIAIRFGHTGPVTEHLQSNYTNLGSHGRHMLFLEIGAANE